MARIMVSIVTGFLGSGKTTLLNSLLTHPGMSDAAVIVNEFGEIGLDYDLVERSDESVVQLENGCLCCTVKSDLVDTFRDLHLLRQSGRFPKFDRVLIETTGIADPGPVLQIILTDPLVSSCYTLDGIVTTIDAINGSDSLARFPESVKQAAVADRIVLTKIDLLDPQDKDPQLQALKQKLLAFNPGAAIVEANTTTIDPAVMFGDGIFLGDAKGKNAEAWLNAEAYGSSDGSHQEGAEPTPAPAGRSDHSVQAYYQERGHKPVESHHAHDPLIKSFCLVREEPIAIDMLRLFLDALAREAGPDLLRVKGMINIEERPDNPAVIQGAQQIFHSIEWLEAWPSADRRTRIVFITRGIDQAHIEDSFNLIERIAARTKAAKPAGL